LAERERVRQQASGALSPFATRMLALAEKNPKDPLTPDALVWTVVYTLKRDEFKKAVEIIMSDHLKSPRIARICTAMIESDYPDAEKNLKIILDKNSARDVRAYACLALGLYYKAGSEQRGFADAEEKAKKAEEFLARVVDQYGNVAIGDTTMSEAVKPALHELRFLAIGKAAPDIEGEDSDGKKFKLSDYRGKVVVLEFWASW